MPLRKQTKKNIALFCLLIYVLFNFLSNAGATLCLGTSQNRHIGIHALNYDSCSDSKICNIAKTKKTFNNYQNKFDYSNFQMALNKIPVLSFRKIINQSDTTIFHKDFYLYQKKYNKIDWEIYKDLLIFSHLKELKTIILII